MFFKTIMYATVIQIKIKRLKVLPAIFEYNQAISINEKYNYQRDN